MCNCELARRSFEANKGPQMSQRITAPVLLALCLYLPHHLGKHWFHQTTCMYIAIGIEVNGGMGQRLLSFLVLDVSSAFHKLRWNVSLHTYKNCFSLKAIPLPWRLPICVERKTASCTYIHSFVHSKFWSICIKSAEVSMPIWVCHLVYFGVPFAPSRFIWLSHASVLDLLVSIFSLYIWTYMYTDQPVGSPHYFMSWH